MRPRMIVVAGPPGSGKSSVFPVAQMGVDHFNFERIAMRADAGGHAASPGRIRATHRASLKNLPDALREFDRVWVYDNTPLGNPRLVLETEGAKIRTVAEHPPSWLLQALKPTEFNFESQSPPLQGP